MVLSGFVRVCYRNKTGLCNTNIIGRRMSSLFKVGDNASFTKKITKEDIERFVELSGDSNPLHLGDGQERAIVHGAYLNGLVSALMGTKLPGPGTLVVAQNLNFPNKCYVGDVVNVKVELVDIRKIVRAKFECTVEEEGTVVLYGSANLILPKS